ncbi:MAG TPA: DEAD/DEAH box helicase family protein [Bacillota bacterium]|nr:DEAD/DEAH box helicase family protein [Bacillota bacterium]
MSHLHQIIAERTQAWREGGYPCSDFPAIAEILEYQTEPETGILRFLRKPQLRALETYWYLRLVEKTPHVFDIYRRYYKKQSELLAALGLNNNKIKEFVLDEGIEALWERIKNDDVFVRAFKLESLRETLTLEYPSYIFALAMGAGKTILIGAIIATEYGMALEYPEGPFVQNALVFAPGKTIIESLRELSQIPYHKILPPRIYKRFAASVKLTFTRDGEKDLPVIRGSSFNVVVTNTEKIRIQKETVRRSDLGQVRLSFGEEEKASEEVANLRLQAIASLPQLAVFSDEAHHTYGQSLLGRWEKDRVTGERVFKEAGIKKVRKTVDYLAGSTDLVCVVNTTGTPYFERQPLKDVVIWYGLSEGISDGILKEVAGNIQAYSFDAANASQFISEVVTDFFRDYSDVRLPNGAPAKLAIYFPQNDDLDELRPHVEAALSACGQSPAIVLKNTSESTKEEIDAFNRLNDPNSPHRVILLVNKGTEGWNCPSLFACALARKLKTSNNFVLQAATRCLRQVPGNNIKARVYLSMDNRAVLDRQLQETYGETLSDLNHAGRETGSATLRLRKVNIPPLVLTRIVRKVARERGMEAAPLALSIPKTGHSGTLAKAVFTLAEQQATYSVLQQLGDTVTIKAAQDKVDVYTAAVKLSATYRLPLWEIYSELVRLYGSGSELPAMHVAGLARQIEEQTRRYQVLEEKVDVALALVKPGGFNTETEPDGTEIYTAEIAYPKDREHLLTRFKDIKDNPGGFGFHYTPYNFDSNPEKSFFEQMLAFLNLHPDDVEDIYFTGALTDPDKTDFFVEYKDEKGKWRRYTPDFIIRKKGKGGEPGKCLIVEIKAERERNHPLDGELGKKAMALRKWEDLNPDRLQYEMIFTAGEVVSSDQTKAARQFVEDEGHEI